MVSFGKTSYALPVRNISVSANPFVTTQVEEFSKLADMGARNVEVGTLRFTHGGPQNAGFESVAKEQWAHIRTLADVIGVEPTLHAPIVDGDPAGFREDRWDEELRYQQQKNLEQVVDAGLTMTKDKPMVVTLHSANILQIGDVWAKDRESGKEKIEAIHVINPVLKNVSRINAEQAKLSLRPGEIVSPGDTKKILEARNTEFWDEQTQTISNLLTNLRIARREEIGEGAGRRRDAATLRRERGEEPLPELGALGEEGGRRSAESNIVTQILNERLNTFSGFMRKSLEWEAPSRETKILYGENKFREQAERYQKLKTKIEEFDKILLHNGPGSEDEKINRAVSFISQLKSEDRPRFLFPVSEVHLKAASETIANAAVHGWEMAKKEGKPAPIISVENPPAGYGPGARADELLILLRVSREKAAQKLSEEQHIGIEEARKIAKQTIGHTIDPSHMWTHKARGYEKEELLEQIRRLAPEVTHMHIADNLGGDDAHTVLGTGTVPNKEALELIQKAGRIDKMIGVYEWGGAASTGEDPQPIRTLMEKFNTSISAEGEEPVLFSDLSFTADAFVYGSAGVSPYFAPYGRLHAQAYGTPGLVPGISRNFLLGYREGGAPRTGGAGFGTPNV